MMTREEVLSIEEYCAEHKISHKKRLEELGIPFWNFYKAKQKYRKEDEQDAQPGQFVQLSSGRYVPQTMPHARTAGKSGKPVKPAEDKSESYKRGSAQMYLLKHMHEMVEIPKEFSDPLFTRLFLLAGINNFTAHEYDQYKKSLENMSDWDNIINSTAERSREEGREEGRAEFVRKMLKAGIAAETIADALDITVEECLSYRK